jgi:hypothetical protein
VQAPLPGLAVASRGPIPLRAAAPSPPPARELLPAQLAAIFADVWGWTPTVEQILAWLRRATDPIPSSQTPQGRVVLEPWARTWAEDHRRAAWRPGTPHPRCPAVGAVTVNRELSEEDST